MKQSNTETNKLRPYKDTTDIYIYIYIYIHIYIEYIHIVLKNRCKKHMLIAKTNKPEFKSEVQLDNKINDKKILRPQKKQKNKNKTLT